MAFTEKIMAPLMPGSSGLESIGSVAASFARQAQEEGDVDFDRYKAESPRSTLIMNMFGQADHDDYVAFVRVETIKAQREKAERQEFRAKQLRRYREGCRQVRNFWGRMRGRYGRLCPHKCFGI